MGMLVRVTGQRVYLLVRVTGKKGASAMATLEVLGTSVLHSCLHL